MKIEGIFLLLGANVGDRGANIAQAIDLIGQRVGEVSATSGLYETAAWGKMDQPSFYNLVVKVNTSLSPESLLEALLGIEQDMGRVRERKWGERLIDLDILYYHDQIINSKELRVPHSEIENRRFTLIPLCDLIPDAMHPSLGKNHRELLQACRDGLAVEQIDLPTSIAALAKA